jgi:hypothetical protein
MHGHLHFTCVEDKCKDRTGQLTVCLTKNKMSITRRIKGYQEQREREKAERTTISGEGRSLSEVGSRLSLMGPVEELGNWVLTIRVKFIVSFSCKREDSGMEVLAIPFQMVTFTHV